MKFACSDTVPCSNIVLNNVNLERKDGTAEAYCNSAIGFGYGLVQPSVEACLTSSDKRIISSIAEEDDAGDVVGRSSSSSQEDYLIHTEL